MIHHLVDPVVLSGLGMVTVGGLLHAVLLSVIADATHAPRDGRCGCVG